MQSLSKVHVEVKQCGILSQIFACPSQYETVTKVHSHYKIYRIEVCHRRPASRAKKQRPGRVARVRDGRRRGTDRPQPTSRVGKLNAVGELMECGSSFHNPL